MAVPRDVTTTEGARGTDGGAITLSRHILESQRQQPRARGELSVVLLQLAFAGKIFSHALRRSALDGRLGATGDRNVQGEATKRLDVFGNDTSSRPSHAASWLPPSCRRRWTNPGRSHAGSAPATYFACIRWTARPTATSTA